MNQTLPMRELLATDAAARQLPVGRKCLGQAINRLVFASHLNKRFREKDFIGSNQGSQAIASHALLSQGWLLLRSDTGMAEMIPRRISHHGKNIDSARLVVVEAAFCHLSSPSPPKYPCGYEAFTRQER